MKNVRFLLFLFVLTLGTALKGQNSQAATLNIYLENADVAKVGDEVTLVVEVTPKVGWHVYSALASEEGAYRPAEVGFEVGSRGFEAVGVLGETGKMIEKFDEIMGGMTRYYKETVVFRYRLKTTEPELVVEGYFDYMGCNEFQCMPFGAEFSLKAKIKE